MASTGAGLDGFFTAMRNQGGAVVPEIPKFDLEPYIQHYDGPTKYERLLLIGRSSVPLCLEALRAAHAEAKKSRNVDRYTEIWGYLRLAAPNAPEAKYNKAWVEATEAANAAETKRLEREVKVYKNNLVKESIRMGHEELGRHLEAIGDLQGASTAYNRMRPDVSTSKHVVDLGRHLVRVAMQRQEWTSAIGQLAKMTGQQEPSEERALQPYLKAMSGVAYLGQEKYDAAAECFLAVTHGDLAAMTDGFISTNDVAIYGGLLALATMDRAALQAKVLDNNRFRTFLELEPHLRRAITQFVNGRYSACLSILASYRPDWMLDLYLQRHLDDIFARIRTKCITSYLVPFSCVTLDSLNAAFAQPGTSIEDELVAMIRKGTVHARIDTIDKLVRTTKESPRVKMHRDALDSVTRFEQEVLDRMRRINIVAAGLEVRGPARQGNEDAWLDPSAYVVG